jgi:hypothetical protein
MVLTEKGDIPGVFVPWWQAVVVTFCQKKARSSQGASGFGNLLRSLPAQAA